MKRPKLKDAALPNPDRAVRRKQQLATATPINGIELRNVTGDTYRLQVIIYIGRKKRIAIDHYHGGGVVSHYVTAHGLRQLYSGKRGKVVRAG